MPYQVMVLHIGAVEGIALARISSALAYSFIHLPSLGRAASFTEREPVVNAAGTAAICHAGFCGSAGAAVAFRNGARLHSAAGDPQRYPGDWAALAVSLRPGAGLARL